MKPRVHECWIDRISGEIFDTKPENDKELDLEFHQWEDAHGDADSDPLWHGNWIVRELMHLRADVSALKTQHKKQLAQANSKLNSFLYLFEEDLKRVARKVNEGTNKKTIHFDHGSTRFRSVNKTLVQDEEAAIKHCSQHLPDAVKTTKKLLVSHIPKGYEVPGTHRVVEEKFSVSTGGKDERP